MPKCEECKREILEGEHCYGPKEYEGQPGPNWALCMGCAKRSNYDLINADGSDAR